MKSINPKNNLVIQTFKEHSETQVSDLIQKTHQRFESWSQLSYADRAKKFDQLAEVLEANSTKYSRLMTDEMGKPLSQAKSEIEKCAWACRYYSENAQSFLAAKTIKTDHEFSEVVYRPLGVILAVMPWNFPFWQVMRFAAPTLMAGNTAVLKHSSNSQGCAQALEEAFDEAGFPSNTFTTLHISGKSTSQVIENDLVRAVSLTGSVEAGRKVAQLAGQHLKKCVLELGGSDPYIILEDAKLADAAKKCAQGRMQNNGQSCIGAKRFIIHSKIYDEFKELFIKEMQSYEMGDPLDDNVQLGPMAEVALRDELHEQVQKSLSAGAKLVMGGEIPSIEGAYYPPTILEEIPKSAPAYYEELFGPVASFFRVESEEEAIQFANDTDFGLGAGVFTADRERGLEIARNKLKSGAAFVNGFVTSDPRLPFGGIKDSGYGRELSANGIFEFVNVKTVAYDKA